MCSQYTNPLQNKTRQLCKLQRYNAKRTRTTRHHLYFKVQYEKIKRTRFEEQTDHDMRFLKREAVQNVVLLLLFKTNMEEGTMLRAIQTSGYCKPYQDRQTNIRSQSSEPLLPRVEYEGRGYLSTAGPQALYESFTPEGTSSWEYLYVKKL